jgi:hypothetical protein
VNVVVAVAEDLAGLVVLSEDDRLLERHEVRRHPGEALLEHPPAARPVAAPCPDVLRDDSQPRRAAAIVGQWFVAGLGAGLVAGLVA